MAISTNNSFLESIISTGADAYSNLYEVEFKGLGFGEDVQSMSVRCKNFTPPPVDHGTYTVKYVTAYIDRPNAKVNVTRTFNLTFRVDANYNVYTRLLNIMKQNHNYNYQFAATDITSSQERLFDVEVKIVDKPIPNGGSDSNISSGSVHTLYKFKGCWITHITPLGFNNSSSNPIEVTATINFLNMEDWQTGFPNPSAFPTTGEDAIGDRAVL